VLDYNIRLLATGSIATLTAMKQCPNPNCILYTRLEELPDAYLKCPGCGGMLVDANTTTSGLGSGYTRMAPSASTFHRQIQRQEDETLSHRGQPQVLQYAQDEGGEEAYEGDAYAYEDEEEGYEAPQRQGLSTASKVVFGLGALMLLIACGLVASMLSSRLMAQGNSVTSAQATETALASLRPAVNTPISILPTVPSSGIIYPTAAVNPPTQAVGAAPSTPLPTLVVAQPTVPPQEQTAGGLLDAQLASSGAGGAGAYKPADTLHVLVQASSNVKSILVRWYGPDGNQIYQVREDYSLPRAYNADFTLKNDGPWPAGSYRVDIHTNDSPLPIKSLSFSVAP